MKSILWLLVAATLTIPQLAKAHCEIPCGIYGDGMRISMLYEHITTVEKSMSQISELSKADDPNWNQLVRWVGNKETHADEIQEIVTQYFLTQRVKTGHPQYAELLATLHQMLVQSMKCKQTTDPAHISNLRELVAKLSTLYFNEADQKHLKEHHPDGK